MLKEIKQTSSIKKKKGLTLVELLGVIVILGIIALIAVPTIMRTIETQRVRAFGQDIAALEKQATMLKPYTTMLDYDKLTDGSNLDPDAINALAQNGDLPFRDGANPEDGSVLAVVEYTGDADNRVYTLTLDGTTYTSSHSQLAEQLGSLFATSSGVPKELRLYPLDVELIYTINGLTNDLSYPLNPDSTYGNKYQGRGATGLNNSTSVSHSTELFPTEPNTSGYFFVVGGNGKVIYTGTDAATDDGMAVHVAGGGGK